MGKASRSLATVIFKSAGELVTALAAESGAEVPRFVVSAGAADCDTVDVGCFLSTCRLIGAHLLVNPPTGNLNPEHVRQPFITGSQLLAQLHQGLTQRLHRLMERQIKGNVDTGNHQDQCDQIVPTLANSG